MPDREKVIKGLEQFKADFKPFCGNGSDWARVDAALSLLREQEPVEPKRVLGVLPDWYHCGACGMDMLDTGDGYRPKYCPNCGRAVKWDG